MNELIKITEHEGRKAVSARELHEFLQSKRDFSNWVKDKIKKYGFVENEDYEVFNNFGENPNGGRPLTEYAISIDMAKEVAMVENNARGKEARKYFIEVERRFKTIPYQSQIPQSYSQALLLAAKQADKIEKQQQLIAQGKIQIQQNAPRVLFSKSVETSKQSILIGDLARIIKQNGVNIGQNRLFKWLRANGYLICRFGESYNQPTQKALDLKILDIKMTLIHRADGEVMQSSTTKVTGKGQIYFVNKFLKQRSI